jgi:Ca2+-binding RTX toxin-like protein
MNRARVVAALAVGILTISGRTIPAQAAVRCYGRTATILGTAGNDTLRGTQRADVIIARSGNDRVFGRGGKDRICGGPGSDVIHGGVARDRIAGFLGRDVAYGGDSNDYLAGGEGQDRLSMEGKAMTLSMGARGTGTGWSLGPVTIPSTAAPDSGTWLCFGMRMVRSSPVSKRARQRGRGRIL